MKTKKAFTLLELMLAIIFVSTLFLSIAVMVNYLTFIYQRGITIKNVNSTGRHIIDDISKSIAASPSRSSDIICHDMGLKNVPLSKCKEDNAYKYTFYQKYGEVKKNNSLDGTSVIVPIYGAFCTGRYSYIWNSGYLFNKNYQSSSEKIKLKEYNGSKPIYLLKVADSKRKICSRHVNNNYEYQDISEYYLKEGNDNTAPTNSEIEDEKLLQPIELIGDSETGLGVYDMRIFKPAIHNTTRQSIYSGTIVLATTMGKIDITSLGEYCKEPSFNFSTDFAYCAINKFNFSARSLGKMTNNEILERNIYDKNNH